MYGIAGLLTGRTLAGRYLIEAVIGRGGMGAVYRAIDERLSRHVAVKVVGAVTTDPAEHQRLRARFHREARSAAALHHPNVVAVHDFGTDPELDLDYLVMELLVGEDLSARLMRAGPPPLPTAISILRQAARGLAAGHRAGMVHRDVKPGNLFLESGDRPNDVVVRVLDFGIAQVEADEATMTHLTVAGHSPFSPAYASPEQLRGEDAITAASDVFSLGAVGYHLVTGVRAFTSSDAARMSGEVNEAVRKLRERAPLLDDRVFAVLVRALARGAGERFRDAGAMAEALGDPAAYGPASSPQPAPANGRGSIPIARVVTDENATRVLTASAAPSTPPQARPRYSAPPSMRAVSTEPAAAPAAPPPLPTQLHHAPPVLAQPGQLPLDPAYVTAAGRSPLRRFLRMAWEIAVTLVSMALFVGSWAAAISGVADDRRRLFLAGAAATVLFTPLAVHRLMGSRGRYFFAAIGSIVATIAAVRVVGTDGDKAILLAAVFGLQVMASFAMEWLSKRKRRPDEE